MKVSKEKLKKLFKDTDSMTRSIVQTKTSMIQVGYNEYLFKANIIDYIQNNVHHTNFAKDIMDYIETQKTEGNFFVTAINKFRKNNNNTDGILELIVLSYLIYYPIVVYDNYNNVKYIFSNGLVKINDKTIKKYLDKSDQNKTIYLKFDYEGINTIPRKIYSIYYKV